MTEHNLDNNDFNPSKHRISKVREQQEIKEALEGMDAKHIIGDRNKRVTRAKKVIQYFPEEENENEKEEERQKQKKKKKSSSEEEKEESVNENEEGKQKQKKKKKKKKSSSEEESSS